MTQLHEPLALVEPVTRDSAVVPSDEDFTRRISSVFPEKASERIVVVSDDPTLLASPCLALEREGYELSFASSSSLLEIVGQLQADLVLLDMSRDPAESLLLCQKLRIDQVTCHMTIIAMANRDSTEEDIASALFAGADDCVVVGERSAELLARVNVQLRNKSYRDALARVRGERDSFRREASLDDLTHLPNRKALFSVMQHNMEQQTPFAVLFLDLDHFKQVNDELGHAMGDEVLRAAAECLKLHSRNHDCCGRFGGEEFLLVLDGATGTEAVRAAERHRRALESLCFRHAGGIAHITASVGIAVYDPEHPTSIEDLLGTADAALYEAKRSGRNRAFIASRTTAPAELQAM